MENSNPLEKKFSITAGGNNVSAVYHMEIHSK